MASLIELQQQTRDQAHTYGESNKVNGVNLFDLFAQYLYNNTEQAKSLAVSNGMLIGQKPNESMTDYQRRFATAVAKSYLDQGNNANMWIWNTWLSRFGAPTELGPDASEIRDKMSKVLEQLKRA